MHLRYVTRSWVASALWLLALHLPRAPSAGWAEASFQGKGGPPQGPGASLPNFGQPATWLASCMGSRAAIARSPVPGPYAPTPFPCSDACPAYGHLPGKPPTLATSEATAAIPRPQREGPAKPLLVSGGCFSGTVGDKTGKCTQCCFSPTWHVCLGLLKWRFSERLGAHPPPPPPSPTYDP